MKILFLTNNPPVSNPLYDWLIDRGEDAILYNDPITAEFVKDKRVDFIISYNYKHIIKRDVIELLPNSIINLHISLLPYNRGLSPNIWSFIDGTPSGVTIHKVDEGIDTGDILLQQEIVFDIEKETLRSSYEKLHQLIQTLFKENWELLKEHKISAFTPPMCDRGEETQIEGFDTLNPGNQLRGKNHGFPCKSECFESERLCFREIRASDSEDIVRWRSDPNIYKHFINPKPLIMKEHLEWYETVYLNNFERIDFIVTEKESMNSIGVVWIYKPNEKICEIGYIIGELSVQGMGYGTEAVDAIVKAFKDRGIETFYAKVRNGNIASIRVMEKNGFMVVRNENGFVIYKSKDLLLFGTQILWATHPGRGSQ